MSFINTIASALNPTRYQITEERVNVLKRLHAKEGAFFLLAQSYAAGGNYRVQRKVESDIRKWVPEELARKWAERDARAKVPALQITDKVMVRFNPRNPRGPFNGFRVVA